MPSRPVLPLLTLAIGLFSGAALSQNQHAVDNASDNASFKRCATEHPTPAEAKKLEKEMREKLARGAAKKPDKPGNGNGGGGNGGGVSLDTLIEHQYDHRKADAILHKKHSQRKYRRQQLTQQSLK